MSDTVTRRWNSFVCPECRFVFRVPRDHDGKGVVCPGCRVMLRLPGPDEELPPLVMPAREDAEPVVVEEFEDEEEHVEHVRGDRNFIAGLALGAVLLLGGVWWWMKPGPEDKTVRPAMPDAAGLAGNDGVTVAPEPAIRTQIMRVEAVVKSFLEASTVAEAVNWVRFPDDTAAKIERQLAGEPYTAPGFQGIVGDGVSSSAKDERLFTLQVRTGNFELREMALLRENGEFRVDWDSWAGWSEMSWEDFQQERPTDPKLFRVVLSQIDYFNFDFKDDREWSSYRLESPDGAAAVYGYVKRTGELDQRIRPLGADRTAKLLLKLKFPKDAMSGNQVLIDSVAGDGWVDLDGAK